MDLYVWSFSLVLIQSKGFSTLAIIFLVRHLPLFSPLPLPMVLADLYTINWLVCPCAQLNSSPPLGLDPCLSTSLRLNNHLPAWVCNHSFKFYFFFWLQDWLANCAVSCLLHSPRRKMMENFFRNASLLDNEPLALFLCSDTASFLCTPGSPIAAVSPTTGA